MNREQRATPLRRDGNGPGYCDIYQRIRSEILSGRLAPGARLSSSRTLANELGVARGTVVTAFQMLAGEGYLVGDRARNHRESGSPTRAQTRPADKVSGNSW